MSEPFRELTGFAGIRYIGYGRKIAADRWIVRRNSASRGPVEVHDVGSESEVRSILRGWGADHVEDTGRFGCCKSRECDEPHLAGVPTEAA